MFFKYWKLKNGNRGKEIEIRNENKKTTLHFWFYMFEVNFNRAFYFLFFVAKLVVYITMIFYFFVSTTKYGHVSYFKFKYDRSKKLMCYFWRVLPFLLIGVINKKDMLKVICNSEIVTFRLETKKIWLTSLIWLYNKQSTFGV